MDRDYEDRYNQCEARNAMLREEMVVYRNRIIALQNQQRRAKRTIGLLFALLILSNALHLPNFKSNQEDKRVEPTIQYVEAVEMKDLIIEGDILKTFNELNLPTKATGEFKTYMDYRAITNKNSKQYALQQIATTDEQGFRKLNGQYLVAVGTYYAKEVGKELRITLEDGTVVYAMAGDIKMDKHTDKNNQYMPDNGNIVEFIVDTKVLPSIAKKLGTVSPLGLEGKIAKIEEVVEYNY